MIDRARIRAAIPSFPRARPLRAALFLAAALPGTWLSGCATGGGYVYEPVAQPYSEADVAFIQGMIPHHAQAVLMSSWAPTHGASEAIRTVAERITVSQTDEIRFMQRWLEERGERVPAADATHHVMVHADGSEHRMLMPGMLTPEQLATLDAARGPEFDRLFLEFMIAHHRGAIHMVDELLASHGAAQDDVIYMFVSDVFADQTSEIRRMQAMLDATSPQQDP